MEVLVAVLMLVVLRAILLLSMDVMRAYRERKNG